MVGTLADGTIFGAAAAATVAAVCGNTVSTTGAGVYDGIAAVVNVGTLLLAASMLGNAMAGATVSTTGAGT